MIISKLKYGLVNTKQKHPATKLYLISVRGPTQAMDRPLNFNTKYFKTKCKGLLTGYMIPIIITKMYYDNNEIHKKAEDCYIFSTIGRPELQQ